MDTLDTEEPDEDFESFEGVTPEALEEEFRALIALGYSPAAARDAMM